MLSRPGCLLAPYVASLLTFLPSTLAQGNATVSNAQSSLTLLYQNNLNFTDDVNHIGAILLDPLSPTSAAIACAALGEQLLSPSAILAHQSDFFYSLSYNAYAGRASSYQQYLIANGTVALASNASSLTFPLVPSGDAQLPVLCTQSSNQNSASSAVATTSNRISVASTGNTFVGFRNQKSFRFLGIRYADPPQRFTYSTPYSPTGQTIDATKYGSECAQTGTGSEDCLFLNIQTPYIPKAGSTDNLRPVQFWIHGGGFTGGTGADPGSDGGQLASREDIVTVTINYRLSTLGFLAIPGTNITGNFGIGDQINALQVRLLTSQEYLLRLTLLVDNRQHRSIRRGC